MTAPLADAAIEVFFSYSHQDENLMLELIKHLSLLKRQGVIQNWHDRQILPGTEWKGQLDSHLETAQIILLLISADFLASDYCYDIEMKRALERHEAREARVIPIILRPVDWKSSPFSKLQSLPKDGKPVTSWTNPDEAFVDVTRGIRLAVETWQSGTGSRVAPAQASAEDSADPPATPPAHPAGQPQGSAMHQTNTGQSTGWQFNVSGGTVNITPPPP